MVLYKVDAWECTCNEAWNMSFHLEGMACVAYGKLTDMQNSSVWLFCGSGLQVVYLMSFVHAQDGWTPIHCAAWRGHVKIAQMLLEKDANIEATDEVQFMANVY